MEVETADIIVTLAGAHDRRASEVQYRMRPDGAVTFYEYCNGIYAGVDVRVEGGTDPDPWAAGDTIRQLLDARHCANLERRLWPEGLIDP